MKNKSIALFIASAAILTVISACGSKTNEGNANAANEGTVSEQPASNTVGGNAGNAEESATPENSPSNAPSEQSEAPESTPDATASADAASSSDEILIIIDQTEKPIEGNSFDFAVNKRPEGYMLSRMEWKGEKHQVINTLQEAIEHGGNGEDGFYISGDGQFMGFFYPDELKGETGDVAFTFVNDQGKELAWKKTITLK